MGMYSTQEFMDLFGGMPEPGEAYDPDPDRRRDEARDNLRLTTPEGEVEHIAIELAREDFDAIEARIAEQYADAGFGWLIAEARESEW